MGRRRNKYEPVLHEQVTIGPAGSQGNCVARINDKVVFVKYAAPGDLADIRISGKKKKYLFANIEKLHEGSPYRTKPFCEHFGTCGGCKWQHLKYAKQLEIKQQEVVDAFQRIGKVEPEEYLPILGATQTREYRNKVEFTFSNKAWLEHFDKENIEQKNALGFHVPKMFDKVLDLNECHLMPELANRIRQFVKDYAEEKGLSFFDIRKQTGFLRNLMIRRTSLWNWMLLLSVTDNNQDLNELLSAVRDQFSELTCILFVVNNKRNDTIYDLPVHSFFGPDYIEEKLSDYTFMVRVKSFFQTNTEQAKVLYDVVSEFAKISENDIVYDLYTGTGSIAIYNAKSARKVIGIEYVEDAVKDARENARRNQIANCTFYSGDMKKVFDDGLIDLEGMPDIVITDPPREGMHPDVVGQILKIEPKKIVYVSCNPATQARDLSLLSAKYKLMKSQAVDMFPHTHHVENVVLLERL